jgi:hypothetical protein
MKKYLKQLEAMQEAMENEINKRHEFFDDKSEKWQDSEKGQDYSNKTDALETAESSITEAIECLKDFLEN